MRSIQKSRNYFQQRIHFTCAVFPIADITADTAADVRALSVGTKSVLMAVVRFATGTFICIYVNKQQRSLSSLVVCFSCISGLDFDFLVSTPRLRLSTTNWLVFHKNRSDQLAIDCNGMLQY